MQNQSNEDREHLKILSICHYVFAGLCVFPFLYGAVYLFIGVVFGAVLSAAPRGPNEPPPELFGGIFFLIGLMISGIALAVAIGAIISGRKMSKLNGRMFSFVFACAICLFVPIGTILGVFTLIVLSRDSVKRLFDGAGPIAPGSMPPDWR
jgi:hypothetical protein